MRDFARISPRFWAGRTGRELRAKGPLAQLVALYLLTSPHHNYIGMYRLPTAYIADDLQLDGDQVAQALADIESAGFAKYDKTTSVVWVIEAAKWQVVECREALKAGDKKCKGVQREFNELPTDCAFLDAFYAKYGTACHMHPRPGMAAATDKVKQAQPVKASLPVPAATQATAADDDLDEGARVARLAAAPTITAALRVFQEWADAKRGPNPNADQHIVSCALTTEQQEGSGNAHKALRFAMDDQDWNCARWEQHLRATQEYFADI